MRADRFRLGPVGNVLGGAIANVSLTEGIVAAAAQVEVTVKERRLMVRFNTGDFGEPPSISGSYILSLNYVTVVNPSSCLVWTVTVSIRVGCSR